MHELLLSTGITQFILSSISGSKGHVSDLRQFHVLHALMTGRFDADSQTRLPPMTIAEALSNKGQNLGIFWCLEGHQKGQIGTNLLNGSPALVLFDDSPDKCVAAIQNGIVPYLINFTGSHRKNVPLCPNRSGEALLNQGGVCQGPSLDTFAYSTLAEAQGDFIVQILNGDFLKKLILVWNFAERAGTRLVVPPDTIEFSCRHVPTNRFGGDGQRDQALKTRENCDDGCQGKLDNTDPRRTVTPDSMRRPNATSATRSRTQPPAPQRTPPGTGGALKRAGLEAPKKRDGVQWAPTSNPVDGVQPKWGRGAVPPPPATRLLPTPPAPPSQLPAHMGGLAAHVATASADFVGETQTPPVNLIPRSDNVHSFNQDQRTDREGHSPLYHEKEGPNARGSYIKHPGFLGYNVPSQEECDFCMTTRSKSCFHETKTCVEFANWKIRHKEILYWHPHQNKETDPGQPLRQDDLSFACDKDHGDTHWRDNVYWDRRAMSYRGSGVVPVDYNGLWYLVEQGYEDSYRNPILFPKNWLPALQAARKDKNKPPVRWWDAAIGPWRPWIRKQDCDAFEQAAPQSSSDGPPTRGRSQYR